MNDLWYIKNTNPSAESHPFVDMIIYNPKTDKIIRIIHTPNDPRGDFGKYNSVKSAKSLIFLLSQQRSLDYEYTKPAPLDDTTFILELL